MGIASLGGILSGAGDVRAPRAAGVGKDYLGLLDAYFKGTPKILENERTYQPQFAQLGLSTLQSLLPGAMNLLNASTPGQSDLLGGLNQQAREGLQAGASLDPSLANVVQQSVRGGQAARGLGFGPADAFQETDAMAQLGNTLRQQRQGFASNVAGMNNQYQTAPLLALLSGLKAGGTSQLTPTSLSGQLLTMPYQGRLQAAQSTAANTTGLYQSMDNNQSSFISGL